MNKQKRVLSEIDESKLWMVDLRELFFCAGHLFHSESQRKVFLFRWFWFSRGFCALTFLALR